MLSNSSLKSKVTTLFMALSIIISIKSGLNFDFIGHFRKKIQTFENENENEREMKIKMKNTSTS